MKPRNLPFILLLCLVLFCGCKQKSADNAEYAYVSAPQVALRDRVAAVYNKVGFVANGDKVRVLDRNGNKRFARVRTNDGKEGWIEVRYLVPQSIADAFARLSQENSGVPTQAVALARRAVNLHVQPARDADALYQLKEGTRLQLLKRASTPKSGLKSMREAAEGEADDLAPAKPAAPDTNPAVTENRATKVQSGRGASKVKAAQAVTAVAPPADPMEDWWLARDEQKRVGWVLGRMLDVEVPLEIAQYAEGQRIVAAFVLNEVARGRAEREPAKGKRIAAFNEPAPAQESGDPTQQVPQYAVLMTEPKDGLPFDFNQLRVFTWNPRRSRYETAYRERLEGMLPFLVGKEDFGKEGVLPTFVIHDRTVSGGIEERKFKMNGVMVRRADAAGAVKGETLRPKSGNRKEEKARGRKRGRR